MTKLSDTQLVLLSTACQREGARILPLTAKLKGGAINIVLGSLHKRGLVEAIPAEAGDEVWAEQDDAPMTLRATAAAYEALGIEVPEEQARGDFQVAEGAVSGGGSKAAGEVRGR